ncbi:MAG TPA: hypothetical protein VFB03_00300 [Candidatus Saccharimonadales bacterium]|nr:hypothetical protein [Candidatus Saccharimonadales bacterium]
MNLGYKHNLIGLGNGSDPSSWGEPDITQGEEPRSFFPIPTLVDGLEFDSGFPAPAVEAQQGDEPDIIGNLTDDVLNEGRDIIV